MGLRQIGLTLCCLSLGLGGDASNGAEIATPVWKRGSFLGMTPGLSDKQAVLGNFGPPAYSGPTPNEEDSEPLVNTEVLDYVDLDVPGRTHFVIDLHTGKVKEIWVNPTEMSLSDLDRKLQAKYFVLGQLDC